jgi:FdhE protein
VTLDDWVRSHPFLEPLARVSHRIDAAVDAAATPLPVPSDWDEYVEEFTAGVPLLHSQMPIDLEDAGLAVCTVVDRLASDPLCPTLAEDAAALSVQLQRDRLAPRRVASWLMGDESWKPVRGGLLRSVGWITFSTALRPLVHAFAEWRDDDRWLRRYCPTCGVLPAMAQLVGVDPGRRRLMACGRCASQWRFVRTGCPFCETESHRLASVGVEGEGGLRIDFCEACRGYLKTYSGQGDERVLLADWTSLHLDVVARKRGLKRMATSLYELEPGLSAQPPIFRATSIGAELDSRGRPTSFP